MAGPNDRLITRSAEAVAGRFANMARAEMDAVWADAHAKWEQIASRQTVAMRDALFVSGFDPGSAKITPYSVTTAVRKGGMVSNALSIKPKR